MKNIDHRKVILTLNKETLRNLIRPTAAAPHTSGQFTCGTAETCACSGGSPDSGCGQWCVEAG